MQLAELNEDSLSNNPFLLTLEENVVKCTYIQVKCRSTVAMHMLLQ